MTVGAHVAIGERTNRHRCRLECNRCLRFHASLLGNLFVMIFAGVAIAG
jgi:hypothetical protein